VTGELISGLAEVLGVVFVAFVKDVGADVQGVVTGNNLTALSHQANSSTWQQTLAIRPNSNRGTENNNQNNFDTNGNLLHLDNIAKGCCLCRRCRFAGSTLKY
jgi:hypothetical protein